MTDLRNLEPDELENLLAEMGEQKFRAKQIFKWIASGAETFDDMTNIPKTLREKLAAEVRISTVRILKVQQSRTDGTRKYLFELEDGNTIESVFMKYRYGNSICVSSQAGCRMNCGFCASAIGGLKRNLTAGEIISELLEVQRDTGEKISHIVVMGTGEPFDNYENLSKFLRLVHAEAGLNISMRNITVSTCGLVPKIEAFAEDFPQVNLAISLHAPNDEIRTGMMPINKRYPMAELLRSCRRYGEKTGRRVTFEYALVSGVNDGKAHGLELAQKLRGMLCHVNLIPLNAVRETGLKGTSRREAEQFKAVLESRGIPVTIRRELGSDIDAACGQLRLGEK